MAAVRALARVVVTAIPALHKLSNNKPTAMIFMACAFCAFPQ